MKTERAKGRPRPNEDVHWVSEEFGGADLGDERRQARLVVMARELAKYPQVSLPQALQQPGALKAAYRFFDNDSIDAQAILAPHVISSIARMRTHPVVLAVQDTTFIDYAGHPDCQGLGPTGDKGGWGMLCHATLAITPEGLPLGILGMRTWARDPHKTGIKVTRRQRPIEEKESQKWIDSVQAVAALGEQLPDTRLVSVADREGDVYEYFARAQALGVDLLVRAAWDRRVQGSQDYLWASLAKAPLLSKQQLALPARPGHGARVATLSLRATQITLRAPRNGSGKGLAPMRLWALWACERRPPANQEPLEWMLLTSVPTETAEQACERLDWYAKRWGIEIWHRALKGGCKIEARQLASLDRLQRLLSVYAVIAWRIVYARMLARLDPDLPSTVLLCPQEWRALYCRIHHTNTPPATAPPLREALRWIARLGGFLARKGDGEPGVQTIWRGFQELITLTEMFRIMNPDNPSKP
jgi:hypothetical protein